MTPMRAEAFGSVHLYDINQLDLLRMYYQETRRHEVNNYSCTFGTFMNNVRFAYHNLVEPHRV